MKDITHVYCSGGGETIKFAIQKGLIEGENVIDLFDDLSIGPISAICEVGQRVNWLKKLYPYENETFFEDFKMSVKSFHQRISTVSSDEIYLWYGENSKEMCNLMYILSLLESKIGRIYTINVSEMVYEISKRHKYSPRSVGEIVPEKLNDYVPLKKPIGNDVYIQYIQLWLKLKKENSNLRAIKDKNVISVQDDYFDEMILNYTSKRFAHCARTVGEAYGKAEKYISDDFIFWRILELIKWGIRFSQVPTTYCVCIFSLLFRPL